MEMSVEDFSLFENLTPQRWLSVLEERPRSSREAL